MDRDRIGARERNGTGEREHLDSAALPARFREARQHVRSGIAQAADAGIENATLAAVLFSEALPRMVDLYGPDWVASMLTRLSSEIAAGRAPNTRRQ